MRPILAFVVLLSACGGGPKPNPRDVADANDTGRTLPPNGPNEQQILEQAGSLPSGTPQKVGSTTVVADAPYDAASGRTCRALRISSGKGGDRHRLACSSGKGWFFVPDVLGLSSTAQ